MMFDMMSITVLTGMLLTAPVLAEDAGGSAGAGAAPVSFAGPSTPETKVTAPASDETGDTGLNRRGHRAEAKPTPIDLRSRTVASEYMGGADSRREEFNLRRSEEHHGEELRREELRYDELRREELRREELRREVPRREALRREEGRHDEYRHAEHLSPQRRVIAGKPKTSKASCNYAKGIKVSGN